MAIRLIAGLGNPGPRYCDTRHNAGFWFVERLAREAGVALRQENRFHGQLGRLRSGDEDVWLLLPQTFMNESGRAIGALARFHRIEPEHILLVHDELDLPPGALRLKQGGGNAGHNGLKSSTAHLGSNHYWRLRVGIGHPGQRPEVTAWVLNAPRADEREAVDAAIDAALALLPELLAGETGLVMQKLHSRKP